MIFEHAGVRGLPVAMANPLHQSLLFEYSYSVELRVHVSRLDDCTTKDRGTKTSVQYMGREQ